jgi:tetratricopeptide (TPR) repeat protein
VPTEAPAVLRALEGLQEFSGRTIAVVGPPLSGKSRILAEIADASHRFSARVVRLKGNYADRQIPFAGLTGLRGAPVDEYDPEGGPASGFPDPGEVIAPMAPVAVNPEELPRAHRRRAERSHSFLLGEPARPRGAEAIDLPGYWEELVQEFRGPEAHPVVLLVDDAAFLDSDSRAFLLGLGARASLRPLLIVLALDSSVAETTLWTEALRGRPGTEWVRQPDSAPDVREVRRYSELLARLPERTARLVGYLALLGGEAPDHLLVRISRVGHLALADLLRPAVEVGLVRTRDGRLTIPDRDAPPILADLFEPVLRAEMHREIAEALEALSPEPTVARRIEVARHYLAGQPGPIAMSRLVDAAEGALHQLDFDTGAELLEQAFGCLVQMPPDDRRSVEPEVRLALSRALFFGGRPAEGEAHLREGIERALEAEMPPADLATALEPVLLAMRTVGPRGSLLTTLEEVAERCGRRGRVEAEILLEVLVTELLVERGLYVQAEETALRVAQLARGRPERHLQALALLAVGLSRLAGDPDDPFPAERFLRSAHHLLGNARRWEFDYLVAELEVRLLEQRGDREQARHLREASLTVLASEKLPSIELAHHLGLAAIDLDHSNVGAAIAFLERAQELIGRMHLMPPSPHFLRYALLDGRRRALAHEYDEARESWSALIDLPSDASLVRMRAEALVRLGVLFLALGREDDTRELGVRPPTAPELGALPWTWTTWLGELEPPTIRADAAGQRIPPE